MKPFECNDSKNRCVACISFPASILFKRSLCSGTVTTPIKERFVLLSAKKNCNQNGCRQKLVVQPNLLFSTETVHCTALTSVNGHDVKKL